MKTGLVKEYILYPFTKMKGAVFTLLTGTASSQLILILAAPLLTRIYDPTAFGHYAYTTLMLSIFVVFSTGKYELGILLQDDDHSAGQIASLAILCSLFTTIIAAVLGAFYVAIDTSLPATLGLEKSEIIQILILSTLLIPLNAIQSVLLIWMNRKGTYRGISYTRFTQAVVMVCTQIFFSNITGGVLGLIIGTAFALILSIIVQLTFITEKNKILSPNKNQLIFMAKKHSNLPKHLISTDMISTLLSQAPVYFLGAYYSSAVVGYFSLAQRTLQAPMQMISSSIGEIFRREASTTYLKNNECRSYFLKTAGILTCIAVPVLILVATSAEEIFATIFGASWKTAGSFASILIIMFSIRFIASPLSFMFTLTTNTKLDLLLHSLFLIVLTLIFWGAENHLHSPEMALWLFSIAYSLFYLGYFLLSYQFSKGKSGSDLKLYSAKTLSNTAIQNTITTNEELTKKNI